MKLEKSAICAVVIIDKLLISNLQIRNSIPNLQKSRGEIFESLVISEKNHLVKTNCHAGLFFWRDNTGHEIDCLIDDGSKITAVEIKSTTTLNADLFKGLQFWQELTGDSPSNSGLVYGGNETQRWSKGLVYSWKNIPKICELW
ncbi:MAG: DUF4143 domain-containing protein [candidate division KSB1 bacterium]|nr:DUF4143 domain-containing protein [candidate division KSB1 bacterium]